MFDDCTQRLECTQDLNSESVLRSCPDQVGYLGICGAIYPVNLGPNKIGRDPQTCNILLDMKSISRQHAVINVLNSKEYMLMDLGSVNKTKLGIKTLQPYIPYPLKNGDTVQFGEVFGVFRLLDNDDDDELPMTQDITMPETPVARKPNPRLMHVTTVPESPDLSDKDDSFIGPSQPIKDEVFKSPSTHFIKPSPKTSKSSTAFNKINNVFWSSSQKSPSLKLLDESSDTVKSVASPASQKDLINKPEVNDIHEMNTQIPFSTDQNDSPENIYDANTQLPQEVPSPSVHNMDTQIPTEYLPQVKKIDNQHEVNLEICSVHNDVMSPKNSPVAKSKENIYNDISLHNADTQIQTNDTIHDEKTQLFVSEEGKENIHTAHTQLGEICDTKSSKKPLINMSNDLNKSSESDEEILSAEMDKLEEEMSRSSKSSNSNIKLGKQSMESDEEIVFDEIDESFVGGCDSQPLLLPKESPDISRHLENEPDNLNEEINSSPIIPLNRKARRLQSDSSSENIELTQNKVQLDDDETDCEEDIIKSMKEKKDVNIFVSNKDVEFDEMATQIIKEEKVCLDEIPFEDCPTQVIIENQISEQINAVPNISNTDVENIEDLATQIIVENHDNNQFSEEIVSPFKVPHKSPLKQKKKESLVKIKSPIQDRSNQETPGNYYDCTQDVMDDLCTQVIVSKGEEEIVPCSDEEFEIGDRFRNIDASLSPRKPLDSGKSSIVDFKDPPVTRLIKKSSSDLSDFEVTPVKGRPLKFMNIELPDSQEIKINLPSRPNCTTESSSESDTEQNSEECTPILFKKKSKKTAKMDLTTKFDVESLPTRVITRVRKPTAKVLQAEGDTKKILKPKFLTEQEDNIDNEILTENIARLKTKSKSSVKNDANPSTNKRNSRGKDQKRGSLEIDTNRFMTEKVTMEKSKPKEQPKRSSVSKSKPLKDNGIEIIINSDMEATKNQSTKRKYSKEERSKTPDKSQVDMKNKKERITRNTRGKKSDSKSSESSKTPQQQECKDSRQSKRHASQNNSENEIENSRKSKSPKRHKTTEIKADKSNTEEPKPIKSGRGRKKIEKKVSCKSPRPKRSTSKSESKDQSAVYNLSSESGTETPRKLKRTAVEIRGPSPKRTRSAAQISHRATPAKKLQTQHVLFTAFPNEEVKNKLQQLGAVIVTDVTKCTVLVTMQIKRTFKLLCVVGLGKPIVGPSWVQACADTNTIVDPWQYLMQDEAAESRFKFSLRRTLAMRRSYLKGYNVSSTPSVMPTAAEMKLIVECSGGKWEEGGSKWMCVSSVKDRNLWPALRKKGAIIVSTEFILSGVLKQELDIENNMLW